MCPDLPLTLRSGARADSAECWRIYRSAVRVGAAPHYSEEQRRAWAPDDREPPWIADRLATGRTWIAVCPDGPVGFLTATGIGSGDEALLDLFFVLPAYRRAGAAALLYDAFAAAAAEAGQGERMTAYASLLLRPFLERRGWQVAYEEWAERSGVALNRFRMAGPGGPIPPAPNEATGS